MELLKGRLSLYCLFLYFFSLSITHLNWTIGSLTIDFRVIALSMAGFFHLLQNRPAVEVDGKLLKTIYLFIILTGLSVFFSVNTKASLVSVTYIIQWLVVFMVINESICKRQDFVIVFHFFIFFVSTLSIRLIITAITAYLSGHSIIANVWIDKVSIPIFLVPNDIVMISVIMPFILCCFLMTPSKKTKVFWLIVLLINFLPALIYLSRTAVIATVISFVFFISFAKSIKKSILYLIILMIAIIVFDGLNSFKMLEKFNGFLYPRFSLWWISLNMFSEAIFFGKGPHTFEFFANEAYAKSIVMPEFLLTQFLSIKFLSGVAWAHNIYLELLAERGLLSFTAFILMLGIALNKLTLLAKRNLSIESRLIALSLISSILVILFAGLVDLTFTHFWLGLILFSLLALVLKIHCLNKKYG